jgi:hypothetical protein
VGQKGAVVEQAQLNLGYTRIFVPVTGEITKRVVVGLNVDPGEQLLTIVPPIWGSPVRPQCSSGVSNNLSRNVKIANRPDDRVGLTA